MVAEEVDPDWPPPAYDPSDDLDTTRPGTGGLAPGRTVWLVVALVALVCLAVVAVFAFGGDDKDPRAARSGPSSSAAALAPTTGTASPTACGPDEATALSAALGQVPPDRKTGKPWDRNASSSNYNACADLSAIVVTVQDGTSSSPDLALMFQRRFRRNGHPAGVPVHRAGGPGFDQRHRRPYLSDPAELLHLHRRHSHHGWIPVEG